MLLTKLEVPSSLNYIAAFVTMSCSLRCSYCINDPAQADHRSDLFPMQNANSHVGLTPDEWITAINRLPVRQDLPISLCGGEPTLFYGNNGLSTIVNNTDNYYDLLTNMGNMKFFEQLRSPQQLQRNSPYPSIRVSWHEAEMNRAYGGISDLVQRCESLSKFGFTVTGSSNTSDVGIYMVAFPENHVPDKQEYENRVPFEVKEFLGTYDGRLYGTYAYPHSTDLVSSGKHHTTIECDCLTFELLVDPMGFIWSCHNFLYTAWANGGLKKEFLELKKQNYNFVDNQGIFKYTPSKPIGHALDPKLELTVLGETRHCDRYGECIGCDTKAKRQHHKEGSEYTGQSNYSSVKIENIKWPLGFKHD